MFSPKKAITLIELLVVITIILFLLAMLVPSPYTVMYQAQLAHCSDNQHRIASAVCSSAAGHDPHSPQPQPLPPPAPPTHPDPPLAP